MGEQAPRPSQPNLTEEGMIPQNERERLIQQLSAMSHADQQARKEWEQTGIYDPTIDQQNLGQLKEIIQKYGWPTRTVVGKEGMYAAWTVAQHGPEEFQRDILPSLEKAAKNNELELSLFALFLDRVAAQQFGKQLFGSQFLVRQLPEGKNVSEPYPLANSDEANLFASQLLSEGWEEFLPLLRKEYEAEKEENKE